MAQINESISVLHDTGDEHNTDVNTKELEFEFNGFCIKLRIAGPGNDWFEGAWITIKHDKAQKEFSIMAGVKNGELRLSLENENDIQTAYRSFDEWLKLERIQSALKLIGAALK